MSNPNVCFKINKREYDNLTTKTTQENLIVTLGEMGASYKKMVYTQSEKGNVFDVVGAGDTSIAALTHADLTYEDITLAITVANKASSIAVQHYGCYTLSLEDVEGL